MTRIVLAEDHAEDRLTVCALIDRYYKSHGIRGDYVCFENGEELLNSCSFDVDLFLLDIEMPRLNGLECAHRIRQRDPNVPLCFLTNLAQLAPAGYEVDAMGFLIKPVSYGMLDRTITRALNKARHHRSALLQLKEGKNSRYVDAHSITYVETVGKHTRVHADSGSFDCGDTLKAIELAAGEGFYRIHNAYLVNLDRIESATQTEVMVANERLPLSKHRRKDFFKALSSYIGGLV